MNRLIYNLIFFFMLLLHPYLFPLPTLNFISLFISHWCSWLIVLGFWFSRMSLQFIIWSLLLSPLSMHRIFQLNLCTAAAAAKSLQSCSTLCDPRDGSLPGSPVPGVLKARTLEWVAISFSNLCTMWFKSYYSSVPITSKSFLILPALISHEWSNLVFL